MTPGADATLVEVVHRPPRRTARRGVGARPSVDFVPAGTEARFEWLRAAPREMDDAVVLAALRTLRDPNGDQADQARAYATIWRSLKPLIEATVIRVQRVHREVPRSAVCEAVDAEVTYILLHATADSLGQFFSYASRAMAHATYGLGRDAQRARSTVSVEDLRVTKGPGSNGDVSTAASFYDHQPAPNESPDGGDIEQTLLAAIAAAIPQERHRKILYHHFGVGPFRGHGEENRKTLGELYGLSGERVRQLAERVRLQLRSQLGLDDDEDDDAS